ncbi:OmpA family protein [Nocardiopsis sp. CA-288880]|uniref:OmpA family protein n=1 Tax=Nocardiopsis sp. CA-288880 TaxID=3239995 RepID=UPI003D96E442
MHTTTRTALAAATTSALLIAPPALLSRQPWPDTAGVSAEHLRLSLLSGTLPPPLPHTLALALLWALWAAFALLVAADTVALLRGQVPRIGLLRLAATGIAGSSVAVSAPAVAAVAPPDTAPTDGAHDAHGAPTGEPAHVLERTRTLTGFGLDSADLTPAMADELGPTVELLQLFGDPDTAITVTGHTDASGPDEHNRALSLRRAETVAAALTDQLGDGWTVTTAGAGSDHPREHPELGPTADRRAEITYTLTTRPHTTADSETEQKEAAVGAAPVAPAAEAQDTSSFPVGAVLAGALAGGGVGGALGAVAGRLTAPGHRGKHQAGEDEHDTEPHDEPGPDDDTGADPEQPLGAPVPVTRDTGRAVISPQGHLRVADNLSVSAHDGLAVTGTHALGVCASLIGRALTDPGIRVITTRELVAQAGASPRVRAPGMTVSADTASAVTEAELAYITAARDEGGPSRTLLVVKASAHTLAQDRLQALRDGEEEGEVTVVILGEEWGVPVLNCDSFDTVDVTAPDGSTDTYDGLRLLHIDQATFAAGFTTTAVGEPDRAGEAVPTPPEEEREEAVPEPAAEPVGADPEPDAERPPKVDIRLFAPQPSITVDGVDIGVKMRSSSRAMLAHLALHPHGVGTDALTEALFSTEPGKKSRQLRSSACTSARVAVREALENPDAEIIDVVPGRYQIHHDTVDVDVWRFDRALQAAKKAEDDRTAHTCLRAAAAEYDHMLLTESDLPWIEEKRQAYRRAAADCFVGLAKAADDPRQALAWLERAREADDLNESIYQELMRTQVGLGRPDAAERTYQDLAGKLKSMRARPSAATRNLLEDLTRSRR